MSPSRSGRVYVGNFPRAAVGVLRGAIARWLVTFVVFLVLAAGCWAAFLPTASRSFGRPAGFVLGFFAAGTFLAVLFDLYQRFGLRVVPQFERKLHEQPGTYFNGRALVWRLAVLDALALNGGATPLSDYGIHAAPVSAWFDASAGRHTVQVLVNAAAAHRWHGAMATDLRRIDAALERAQAEGVRFRLVVVADLGMNGRFWNHLREAGF